MLELPEAQTVSRQIAETLTGKVVTSVVANHSPHAFAFFSGEPSRYDAVLRGKTVTDAQAYGGMVELYTADARLVFGDGANLRYYADAAKIPAKHQLLVEFEDGTALVCTVAMYGGMWLMCGDERETYNDTAHAKPNPLSDAFDSAYFAALRDDDSGKLSCKAFLATKQRIPGLGNGVLQDILFNAGVHPKRKMQTLSDTDYETMYRSVKDTLRDMTQKGGRDTEKDLYGNIGGYKTLLSNKTKGQPCVRCGGDVKRMAYLGGNIYVCETCQPL